MTAEIPSYVHGACDVPLTSDTIGGSLDRIARDHPRRDAVVSPPQRARLTYAELRREARRIARGLMALGLERGDRLAIWSPNCAEWLVGQYAAAKAGAVLVHLNPTYKSGELERVLNHSGATVLVMPVRSATTDCRAVLADTHVPGLRHVVCLASERVDGCLTWAELGARADSVSEAALRAREASVNCEDAASIMYTSGTTGDPKAAVLSHHSVLNCGFFIGERLRYTDADRVCLPVPLYHTFGHMLGSLAALTHGSAVVLPGAIFDAKACLESIEDERCTAFYGVPAMFSTVLRHPRFAPERVASLRTGIMAGAPCPVDLMRDVMSRLHMPEVTICYGLTEGGTLCQSVPDDPVERRVATVGAVHPHVECRVVDPATGRTVPRGTPGELWARGYGMMSGYWNNDAATREIVRPGGWLRTGDLAVMRDDGYLNIVGRLKEMVISGGRNIYPREIEDVLRAHPKISEVAVIGVPDPVYGEATCAWIQPRDGETLGADEVRRFCRRRVAAYKVPRRVRFTDRLPLTASGKVQKFRLRELAVQELGLAQADRIETA